MMNTGKFAWVALAAMIACDSPLDTDPTASIDSETALRTARGVSLAVNGAYRALQGGDLYGVNLMVYPDMYADNLEFTGTFQTDREVGNRNISATNTAVLNIWADLYDAINRTNNILDAIPNVGDLTQANADRYRGEALFLRALSYSLLLNYFGDVPLLTTPSRGVGEESLVGRDAAATVYSAIIADLETAVPLLPAGRTNGRATQGAANALLARLYLETGAYTQARDKAAAVIGDTDNYTLPATFADVFAKNSSESIFELQYSINNSNNQAFWFYPADLGGRLGYAPTAAFFGVFEAGDARRDFTIGDYQGQLYGNKYRAIANGDDNIVILRLAEMYLIRAEANARLGADPATVRADMDVLRARAGLAALTAEVDTEQELLDAVLHERRVELAFEGHRFFDLRRHGVASTVLTIPESRLLWPIPQAERDVNGQLAQNPGY